MNEIAAYGGFPDPLPALALRHGVRAALQGLRVRPVEDLRDGHQQRPLLRVPAGVQRGRRPEAGDGPRLRALRLLQEQLLVPPDQPPDDRRDGQPRHPRAPVHRQASAWRRSKTSSTVPVAREPDRPARAAHPPQPGPASGAEDEAKANERVRGLQGRAASTWTGFINPPEFLDVAAQEAWRTRSRSAKKFPERPAARRAATSCWSTRRWRRGSATSSRIVRDEAYYFAPQGQTKIMNEGWASYWHSTIMTRRALKDDEIIDYADHHSGTMAHAARARSTRTSSASSCSGTSRSAGTRASSARSGTSATTCGARGSWDKKLGAGPREDLRGPQASTTTSPSSTRSSPPSSAIEQKLFVYGFNDKRNSWEILRPRVPQGEGQAAAGADQLRPADHRGGGRQLREPQRAAPGATSTTGRT